jgi:class 3 adenylate cyclase
LPFFIDRHDYPPESITPQEIVAGHIRDLQIGLKHGVRFISYWSDPATGIDFCYFEAPNPDALIQTHREAHGDLPTRIIQVDGDIVGRFFGRMAGDAQEESSFRTILFTDLEGSTSMTQRLGDSGAMNVLREHDAIVRRALATWFGSEVKHTGDGIMASFISAVDGVQAAIAMQRDFAAHNTAGVAVPLRVRIGLSAGEPVTDHGDIFGAAVQLARRCCDHGDAGEILVASVVRDLCIGKGIAFSSRGGVALKGFDEEVSLFEVRWQERLE